MTDWRVGVLVVSGSREVRNLNVAIPVPSDWPEQSVEIANEEVPSEVVDFRYEKIDGNVRRLAFNVPEILPRQKFLALVTFRVTTMQVTGPADPSQFSVPKRRTKDIRGYLTGSPEISMNDARMKRQAKELFEGEDSDWVKIERVFDWVRDEVEQRDGDPVGNIETFREKSGAPEDRVGLFISMCRINKVPARMVFVDGTQYAEFYLLDGEENGHWFPCNVAGIREFGELGEPRVVLQKGDNMRLPDRRDRLKFIPAMAETNSKPAQITFIREPLSQ